MKRPGWTPLFAATATGLLLAAAPALAQDGAEDDYDENDAQDFGYGPEQSIVPQGASLAVGGGVAGFTDTELRDMTNDVGGSWEARLTYGTRSLLGIEAAYIGNAIGVSTLGLNSDAALVGHGGELDARLNFGIFQNFQPYVLAGVGVMRYDLRNVEGANTSALSDDDTIGIVPVGVGMNYHAGRVLIDLRGGVKASFDDDLVQTTDDSTTLSTWNVDARVGFEF